MGKVCIVNSNDGTAMELTKEIADCLENWRPYQIHGFDYC